MPPCVSLLFNTTIPLHVFTMHSHLSYPSLPLLAWPCTPHACVYSPHHHWTHFLSSIHSPPIPHPFISHLYAHLFLLTHLLFPPPFLSLSPPTHFLTSCPLYSRPISCTGRYICKARRWSCWMFFWNAQLRDKSKWRLSSWVCLQYVFMQG